MKVDCCRFIFALSQCILCVVAATTASASNPYSHDPMFNDGRYVVDGFGVQAGQFGTGYGYKTLVSGDGDVIAIGLLTWPLDMPPTQFSNLGIVRYDATGQRVQWNTSGNPYAWRDGDYLVYPQDEDAGIFRVGAAAIFEGRLHVLVEVGEQLAPADVRTDLLVFDEQGNLISSMQGAFASDNMDFNRAFSAGIAMYRPSDAIAGAYNIVIAANTSGAGGSVIRMTRLNVAPGGGITRDVEVGYRELPIPAGFNWVSGACGSSDCSTLAMEVASRQGFGETDGIYIGGSVSGTSDVDLFVMKIDVDGVLWPGFGIGGSGIAVGGFNVLDSTMNDFAVDLLVQPATAPGGGDRIWLAARVDQAEWPAIGIMALRDNGTPKNGFAANGLLILGGSNCTFECPTADVPGEYPVAMSFVDERIAIAGSHALWNVINGVPTQTQVDGSLAIVDAGDGRVLDFRIYPNIDENGIRVDTSVMQDVAATVRGFVTTGIANAPGLPASFMTGMFVGDRIFADGFDCLGGCGPSTVVFTDRMDFLANVATGAYEEGFDTSQTACETSFAFNDSNFGFVVSESGGGLVCHHGNGYVYRGEYGGNLVLDFSGSPVTAFGANFRARGSTNESPYPTTVTITLSDGTVEAFQSTSVSDFRGFTSATPITGITMMTAQPPGGYPLIDNVVMGLKTGAGQP